jgi:hypothetical protein
MISFNCKKACKIKLQKGVNITVPTSEKNFIGNYPIYTNFDMGTEHCIFGINWREKDGLDDLDLSITDINGNRYGWNTSYTNRANSIIYSGDMTSANPEATELFYAKNGFTPSIVKVNMYRGELNSPFNFFIAKEPIKNLSSNYMVNPDNILFKSQTITDSKEKSLGIILDNKFILTVLRTGNKQVSNLSITDLMINYTLDTLDCNILLENLLIDAGFEIVEKDADIDLTTNFNKSTLIDLLS